MKAILPAFTLLVFSSFGSSASPAQYFTVDFPGATYTTLNGGPNPSGEVVGTYVDKANVSHGFLLQHDGTFKTIDFPGAAQTALNGWIDSEGDIVGQYTDAQKTTHGFLLEQGNFQTIDYPGSTFTSLGGINSKREIIGTYCIATQCGVFTYNNGNFQLVTIAGGTLTFGASVNTSGTLVASCMIGARNHICLIDKGKTTVVDYPTALGTSPGAMGDRNELVGAWTDAQNHTHGFLRKQGVFTCLDPPGSTFTYASGISADGVVIGQFLDANGKSHGFVVRPVSLERRSPDDGERRLSHGSSSGDETQ